MVGVIVNRMTRIINIILGIRELCELYIINTYLYCMQLIYYRKALVFASMKFQFENNIMKLFIFCV